MDLNILHSAIDQIRYLKDHYSNEVDQATYRVGLASWFIIGMVESDYCQSSIDIGKCLSAYDIDIDAKGSMCRRLGNLLSSYLDKVDDDIVLIDCCKSFTPIEIDQITDDFVAIVYNIGGKSGVDVDVRIAIFLATLSMLCSGSTEHEVLESVLKKMSEIDKMQPVPIFQGVSLYEIYADTRWFADAKITNVEVYTKGLVDGAYDRVGDNCDKINDMDIDYSIGLSIGKWTSLIAGNIGCVSSDSYQLLLNRSNYLSPISTLMFCYLLDPYTATLRTYADVVSGKRYKAKKIE